MQFGKYKKDQDVNMGLPVSWQKVEIFLGKLCEFVLDFEDTMFSIQMELFELVKGKHVYSSWCYTFKLQVKAEFKLIQAQTSRKTGNHM